MSKSPKRSERGTLHPRNLHQGSYDLALLAKKNPDLLKFIFTNQFHNQTIDFSDPQAVKNLNLALLKHFYGLRFWDIPDGFLCPPIPGRVDYIHHSSDLLASVNHGEIPIGKTIQVLDIGTGANLIYPILGNASYGWSFTCSESNLIAINAAEQILAENPQLKGAFEIKHQRDKSQILGGIIEKEDFFDLTICNPPFHTSAEEAQTGSRRKIRNLSGKEDKKPSLNFGGKADELWCEGGELAFVGKLIQESQKFRHQVCWFSSLISKEEHLKALYSSLKRAGVSQYKTIAMAQGNKKSRFIAWTFLSEDQQESWRKFRWK